jgi:uncharacterized protein
MKRFLLFSLLCLPIAPYSFCQQAAADPSQQPASKEDVQRYLALVGSHDQMMKMMDAMSKPMHEMVHQEYLKQKDKLPADFEARMNKMMDDMFQGMPLDEIMQSMIPTYQKYFTKSDMDSLVAFYSGPTGQKMLRQMPQILAESMRQMMPLLQRHIDEVNARIQQQIAEMLKEAESKPDKTPTS